jgi:hypothetical protein
LPSWQTRPSLSPSSPLLLFCSSSFCPFSRSSSCFIYPRVSHAAPVDFPFIGARRARRACTYPKRILNRPFLGGRPQTRAGHYSALVRPPEAPAAGIKIIITFPFVSCPRKRSSLSDKKHEPGGKYSGAAAGASLSPIGLRPRSPILTLSAYRSPPSCHPPHPPHPPHPTSSAPRISNFTKYILRRFPCRPAAL